MTGTHYFTDDQLAAFARDGYVVVRGLYDDAAMAEITSWTEDMQGRAETAGEWMKYFDDSLTAPGERVLNRVENFCPYHQGFDTLLNHGELPARVGELFGETAVMFKEKINFKMPGGVGFEPHQDIQAGWDSYAARHITALVCVDAATTENGCLEVAAGHHRRGIVGESWTPMAGDDLDGVDFVSLPTEPGGYGVFRFLHPPPVGAQPDRRLAPGALRHLQQALRRRPPGQILRRQTPELSPRHRTGAGQGVRLQGVARSNLTAPPTKVRSVRVSRISSSGTENTSRSSTATSASLPTPSEPLECSSPPAWAPRVV